MKNKLINSDALLHALSVQAHMKAELGEILLANKYIVSRHLGLALAEQVKLPFIEFISQDDSDYPHCDLPVSEMMHLEFIPVFRENGKVMMVMANPRNLEEIQDLCMASGYEALYAVGCRSAIQSTLVKRYHTALAYDAETVCPQPLSIRRSAGIFKRILKFVLFMQTLFFLAYLDILQVTLLSFALVLFLSNITFKILCLFAYIKKKTVVEKGPVRQQKLDKVSILVPLFHETQIVTRLIPRLSEIDYPRELLEIFLICEESDTQTQDAIRNVDLPGQFRFVIVPKGSIQTKPRALNFALSLCKGEIIGVYDAEDAPQCDQVYKAVRHFQNAKPDVVCVQARLDFFNATTNWLSRCFTFEYAIHFRVLLHGLQRMRLPLPLGGTSMFLRRSFLQGSGQWDAHNVTEDADLGMRIYRYGYRVECLDSTTFEEANYRFKPWVRQRSRWLKGYYMTWITHMKHPIYLLRDLGLFGFLFFNLFTFGTVASYLVMPFILPYWLLTFGFMPEVLGGISSGMMMIMILLFGMGEPMGIILGLLATNTPRLRKLRWFLPLLIFYWPLGCFAAYKAAIELLIAPNYWDKTAHGINDSEFDEEILKLTASNNQ